MLGVSCIITSAERENRISHSAVPAPITRRTSCRVSAPSARRNGSVRETFTVRRNSYGIGVERTFPLHSPRVDSITVTRRGKVRRAKLYYLRGLSGKAAKVKEK